MAIATATSLDVYVGGKLLFEDVSFKLEPRERMTLSGRNGAGKSTLLRVLAGERPPDAGSLALQRGARVALHDQRPPRDVGDLARRVRLLRPHRHARRPRPSWSGWRRRWRGRARRGDDARLRRRPAAARSRRRLPLARRRARRPRAASASSEEAAERPLSTFSGGELTRASLARALATRPDLLLLDEPTNHLDIPSLEWLERYLVDLDAAVVLVAHDRWFLEAVGTSVLELEAQRGPLLRRPLARLAQGAGGAGDRPRQGDRAPAGGDRADGALRRALPLQGDEGAPGAVAGEEDRARSSATGAKAEAARQPQPALLLQTARAARPGGAETGQRRRSRCRAGRCSTAPTSKSNAASTSSWSAPTAPARRP